MADAPPPKFDLCIDALLGIGATLDPNRSGSGLMLQWLGLMQASEAPCLAVDVPTGLGADTGVASATLSIAVNTNRTRAKGLFTLSLLTLKPGLFTHHGRDSAGEVWFDDLGVIPQETVPCALLLGADRARQQPRARAAHASHKGSFGDVAVVGGQSGDGAATHMTGAALLAARAALHAGAGRVFVALLGNAGHKLDLLQPELMFRASDALDLAHQVVVCGCGGGESVKTVIPDILAKALRLVLDADALNAIAGNTLLQRLLAARRQEGCSTVLTPHPLEAARLAGLTAAQIQADRLAAAERLAERFQCVVVLKGSGTVVAAPGQQAVINSTGNALLATAGTGDVLAGMVGAGMASGQSDFEAACSAVFTHGRTADAWAAGRPGQALTASALAAAISVRSRA